MVRVTHTDVLNHGTRPRTVVHSHAHTHTLTLKYLIGFFSFIVFMCRRVCALVYLFLSPQEDLK